MSKLLSVESNDRRGYEPHATLSSPRRAVFASPVQAIFRPSGIAELGDAHRLRRR